MEVVGLEDIRELIEAAVTAVSVLGGAMAYFSGRGASKAISEQDRADAVSERVNNGLAIGFDWGTWLAAIAFMIVV